MKKRNCSYGLTALLALAGTALLPATTFAQSDSCATATAASLGTNAVNTTGFTSELAGTTCQTNAALDGWFSFTADGDGGNYKFETLGPGTMTDTVLSVYDVCGGTQLACDDDAGTGLYSLINSLALAANQTVVVRVAGYNGANGTCNLEITDLSAILPPANDTCGVADIVLADGANGPFTSAGATQDGSSPSCGFDTSFTQDVWFSYTASSGAGIYSFDTEGSTTLTDTVVSIYDGCGGNEIGCDDDGGTGLLSLALANLTASQNVVVRVAGYQGATGIFNLNVNFLGAGTPGDTCDSAVAAAQGDFPLTGQDNSVSLQDGPVADCAFFGVDGNDLYYEVTPSDTGTAVITLTPEDGVFDSVLSAAADCSSIDFSTNCSDAGADGDPETVSLPVTAGVPFIIRAAGWNGATGLFTLDMIVVTGTPANDDCANAIALTLDTVENGTNINATGTSLGCTFDASPDDLDVFYSFTNTGASASNFHVTLSGGSLDTILAVFSDCTLSTRLGCSDFWTAAGDENFIVALNPMQSMIIRVSGSNNAQGNFTVLVTDEGVANPANASCAGAVALTEGVTLTDNSIQVATDGNSSTCSTNNGPFEDSNALFYSFTADGSGGDYRFVLECTTFDMADATLSIFPDCASVPFGALACVNDNFAFFAPDLETTDLSLAPNQSVIVRVGGAGLIGGEFNLTVTKKLPPANDTCATAIDASAGGEFTVEFPDLATASDGVDPSCDGATVVGDAAFGVWYTFSSPVDNGVLSIDDVGPNFTNYAVYTGSCGSLTEVACSGTFNIDLPVTAGTTYYILMSMDDDTIPAGAYISQFVFAANTGACCDGSNCTIVSHSACNGISGAAYQGDSAPCGTPAGSPSDFNGGSNLPLAIVDNATGTSDIVVGAAFPLGGVSVTLQGLTHSFAADLDITLSDGTVTVPLTLDRGGGDDLNGDYTFSDAATILNWDDATLNTTPGVIDSGSSVKPESPLNDAFFGRTSAATWTLSVSDDAGGDTGNLTGWTLSLDGIGTNACAPALTPCQKAASYAGDTGLVEVGDLFAFLDLWFLDFPNGAPTVAQPNGDFDGDSDVDVSDLFQFLDEWFAAFGNGGVCA